ncbi:MAG: beta-lactamase family protein [Lewinellaceae bacterium]|nr:beta-lactamase family protein [Lewinellaceae bacterium]
MFKAHSAARKIPRLVWGVVVDDSLAVSGATGLIHLGQKRLTTTRSAFRIASMTKSFTGTIGYSEIAGRRKLSLSDPVSRYIPEMSGTGLPHRRRPSDRYREPAHHDGRLPRGQPWGDRQLTVTDETLIGT